MGSIKVAALVGAAGLFLAYFMALEVRGVLLCFSVSVFRDSSSVVLQPLCLLRSTYSWLKTGPFHVVRLMIDAEIIFHRSRQK